MTESHLDEWHDFSSRYGLHRINRQNVATWGDKQPWAFRHGGVSEYALLPDVLDTYADGIVPICECPGPKGYSCLLPMTQEDLYCDECRRWCWAVDDQGVKQRLKRAAILEEMA